MQGNPAPGQLMPSTRVLADQLRVSRTTVVRAYNDLIGQGYIKSIDGIGTFVAETTINELRVQTANSQSSFELSRAGSRLLSSEKSSPSKLAASADLSRGVAPAEFLPVKQWRQIVCKYFREHEQITYDHRLEPLGYLPLRDALANYLNRARSITCESAQIAVFPESLDALKLLSTLLLDESETVIVEDPTPSAACRQFAATGANVFRVPIDDQGIRLDYLVNNPIKAKMLYVTPSHQDPTGVVMSLERRRQLIAWAQRNNTLIIEDDYDCEYRLDGGTVPALHAMSSSYEIVYLSSFRKLLYPLVDTSYLVAPAWLTAAISSAISTNAGGVTTNLSLIEQNALTEFVGEGHLERHVRKSYPAYRSRWRAAVAALTRHLKNDLDIRKGGSSTHLYVRFADTYADEEISRCAEDAGLNLLNLRDHYHDEQPRGAFMISFAHHSESEIEVQVERFAKNLTRKIQPQLSDYLVQLMDSVTSSATF